MAIVFLLTLSSIPAQIPERPIFVYRSGFWLSLHHYLYVLGRVDAKMPDIQRRAVAGAPDDEAKGLATLNASEVQIWKDIVREYGTGLSRMDAVFDDRMVTIGRALAAAGNVDSLERSDVEPNVRKLLERAAPVYRRPGGRNMRPRTGFAWRNSTRWCSVMDVPFLPISFVPTNNPGRQMATRFSSRRFQTGRAHFRREEDISSSQVSTKA